MEVLNSILAAQAASRKLLALLIDPEKDYSPILSVLSNRGAVKQSLADLSFLLIGGSTAASADACVHAVKAHTDLPVILFPGNIGQVTPAADALFFLSLLSSESYDLTVGQQLKAARQVASSGIESIPMGYILVDGGSESSVQRATHSNPIPQSDINQIVTLAVGAQLLGKQLVYLEAGSGARTPISTEVIKAVRSTISIPLIIGGGICTPEQMIDAFTSGADLVVIGNHFESHPTDLPLFCSTLHQYFA